MPITRMTMSHLWRGSLLLLPLLCILHQTTASTEELLRCRSNLDADIKNEFMLTKRVKQADYVFTGKISEMKSDGPQRSISVRVKRIIKADRNHHLDEEVQLRPNDTTCAVYIKRSYTGIFLAVRSKVSTSSDHQLVMHFGPVPLTVANLDRINAAIQG
ncbi:hypothetical protein QAD02_024257 [Eretmocerus hayati]|uniref:Uncharacterized protein n=1 Tax=Eretmocerus hayati TaxID=131215 RepID=A0ACC2PYB6_9HYME|nr:hypothetical protein QAD02_024257 [Eretmocerus hayati]